jgi:peroxiredoxin
MPNTLNNAVPLEYGSLAPNFELEAVTGKPGRTVTRHQFRNKSGLVLVFFQPTADAQSWLQGIDRDQAEYIELNARVLGIGAAASSQLQAWAAACTPPFSPFIELLADPDGGTWKAYMGTDQPGYAVLVLDMYGGVDAQQVSESFGDMPSAPTILSWSRAAQYRCNI